MAGAGGRRGAGASRDAGTGRKKKEKWGKRWPTLSPPPPAISHTLGRGGGGPSQFSPMHALDLPALAAALGVPDAASPGWLGDALLALHPGR